MRFKTLKKGQILHSNMEAFWRDSHMVSYMLVWDANHSNDSVINSRQLNSSHHILQCIIGYNIQQLLEMAENAYITQEVASYVAIFQVSHTLFFSTSNFEVVSFRVNAW